MGAPGARVAGRSLAAVLAFACSGLVSCGIGSGRQVDCESYRFDPVAWRASTGRDPDTPTTRQRSADALLHCRTLQGLRRPEVHRMLGPPDGRTPGADLWVTGRDRGYGVDYEELRVRFGRGRRVVSAALVQG